MQAEKRKRVVVGLSGGVDSSVAAYLLKEQGYEVIGLFMKNWHDTSVTISKECPWVEDSNDALMVARALDIPFSVIDLSEIYRRKVVDYMFGEYEKGRTPNPDVLCNREIKFDVFLNAALELGADYVATGHYARIGQVQENGGRSTVFGRFRPEQRPELFPVPLSQQQLAKAMFPIGDLLKPEVRAIAARENLVTAEKKDSQGICFVGKVKLPEFLKQRLAPKEGDIVEIAADSPVYREYDEKVVGAGDLKCRLEASSRPYVYRPTDGRVAGRHHGAHFFTVGQRKGLDVGGRPGTPVRDRHGYGGEYHLCRPRKIASGAVPPFAFYPRRGRALGAAGYGSAGGGRHGGGSPDTLPPTARTGCPV